MGSYRFCGRDDSLPERILAGCREKLPLIWDGEWFLRAFTAEGEPYGTAADEWNRLFLNPQSWAVLSGLPDREQANRAFDAVMRELMTEWELVTHAPASDGYDLDRKCFFPFAAGSRENGGIFYHSNTWAIIALTMLGRADDAMRCYRSALPSRRNDSAEVSRTEPYVYVQTMLGPRHPDFGKCSNSWLTGTASWMYLAATRYLLGIRPDYEGILLLPCIPADWEGFSARRVCRGVTLQLRFRPADRPFLSVGNRRIEGSLLPWELLGEAENGCLTVEVGYTRS